MGHNYLGSAMYAAAFNDDEALAETLIGWGIKTYMEGGAYRDALQLAAYRGSNNVAKRLMAAGAGVRTTNSFGFDDSSNAPLHLATKCADWFAAQQLIQRDGIKTNSWCNNYFATLSVLSAARGDTQFLSLFLRQSTTNVNLQNRFGRNALGIAVSNAQEEAVRMLLEHPKIYVHHRAEDGTTAILMAARGGPIGIMVRLPEKGALFTRGPIIESRRAETSPLNLQRKRIRSGRHLPRPHFPKNMPIPPKVRSNPIFPRLRNRNIIWLFKRPRIRPQHS
ncbi:Ankyrin repeat and death domain-containing protein 1A [Aspergillus hancockii]|nr:Ankyrin repeat and death domain-containing protein 1A [Aspergillus hancockii]